MYDNLLKNRGLTIERMRKFLQVVEARSIGEAVRKNGSTQTAYSRDISELESFFDAELFEKTDGKRGGRTLSQLTPRGEALRDVVTDFFDSLERVIDFRQTPSLLRIGAGESALQWMIAGKFEVLRSAFPQIQIQMKSLPCSDIIRGIENGTLDVGFVEAGALPQSNEHIDSLPVGELSYTLYLSQKLFQACQRQSERTVLEQLPLVCLEDLESTTVRWQEMAFTNGYSLHFKVVFSSFPQILSATRQGGVAALLPSTAESEMRTHGLHRLSLPFTDNLKTKVLIVWNNRIARYLPFQAQSARRIQQILSPA